MASQIIESTARCQGHVFRPGNEVVFGSVSSNASIDQTCQWLTEQTGLRFWNLRKNFIPVCYRYRSKCSSAWACESPTLEQRKEPGYEVGQSLLRTRKTGTKTVPARVFCLDFGFIAGWNCSCNQPLRYYEFAMSITNFQILQALFLKCLSPSMGILNICNLWILLRKIVIYLVGRKCHLHGRFAVKVDGNDVNPGICKEVFIYTDSWVDVILTSLRQL